MIKGNYYIGDLLPIFGADITEEYLDSIDKNVFIYMKIPETDKNLHDQFNRQFPVTGKYFGCIMIEYIDNIEADFSKGIISNYYDNFTVWKSEQRFLFGNVCVELY